MCLAGDHHGELLFVRFFWLSRGGRDFKLPDMALRGRAVVALVERQGEYETDVVCDACAIMRALQRTSVQTAGPCCHSVTGWLPLIAERIGVGRWLKVVDVSCSNMQFFFALTYQVFAVRPERAG